MIPTAWWRNRPKSCDQLSKSSYFPENEVAQATTIGRCILSGRFIPSIFGILRLYDGLAKAVKLDIWAVDEYFLERT